jgi:GAF domain-containing protein
MVYAQPMKPSDTFARPERIEPSLRDVFQRVVDLTKLAFPEVAAASVTVVRGRDAHTPAHTGDLAFFLDESQYRLGGGPCLLAASAVTIESVGDMATEGRWPDWTAGALKAGVRSSLSVAVPIQDGVSGAMNLYATTTDAFDDDDIAVAQSIASYASLASSSAYRDNAALTLSRHLEAAMGNEPVIEQAKGITMGDRRCTAEEAYGILTTTAQDTDRTVRAVAQALVDRATEPTAY